MRGPSQGRTSPGREAVNAEILQLQDMKLAALDAYRAAHPGSDPFEDRSLEVIGTIDVRAMVAA